mgnify:FL=1
MSILYHRSFCSDCKAITVHTYSEPECVHHHNQEEDETVRFERELTLFRKWMAGLDPIAFFKVAKDVEAMIDYKADKLEQETSFRRIMKGIHGIQD